MLVCTKCNKQYPKHLPQPIHCPCGNIIGKLPYTPSPPQKKKGPARTYVNGLAKIEICRSNRCGHYLEEHDACDKVRTDKKAGLVSYLYNHPTTACPVGMFSRHTPEVSHYSIEAGDRTPDGSGKWITTNQLTTDTLLLLQKIKHLPIRRVVGVPRSGMLSASIIATHLGVPLGSFRGKEVTWLDWGVRNRERDLPQNGITLLVDDSVASGFAINKIRGKVEEPCQVAVVYATPSGTKRVDHYEKELPLPHFFEWNLFTNPDLIRDYPLTTDMDGILCEDCPPQKDDDGDGYLDFLANTRPYLLPTVAPVRAIITARLEKYRPQTEAWLRKYGVQYKELIMGPWSSLEERQNNCVGTWKKTTASFTGTTLFVESDPVQARIIKQDIPTVLCPALGGTV